MKNIHSKILGICMVLLFGGSGIYFLSLPVKDNYELVVKVGAILFCLLMAVKFQVLTFNLIAEDEQSKSTDGESKDSIK